MSTGSDCVAASTPDTVTPAVFVITDHTNVKAEFVY